MGRLWWSSQNTIVIMTIKTLSYTLTIGCNILVIFRIPVSLIPSCQAKLQAMGVWQEVAMDFLKFHPGSPCPTLLRPVGGPPLKRPYGRFRGGPPSGRAACSRLLALRTPTPYAHDAKPSPVPRICCGFVLPVIDLCIKQAGN
jgi:hypothetical protein